MIYIMIFGGIFAFSYLLFWESSQKNLQKQKNHIKSLETKIRVDSIYLKANPPQKIVKIKKQIKKIEQDIVHYKDNNAYIKNKIEAISFLIYDEKRWGQYLYSISEKAKKYDVALLSLTNKKIQNESAFGHILDISIRSSANFKNTLLFINSLEESSLVVDIHNLNIKANKELYTDLNLSVWGIRYR